MVGKKKKREGYWRRTLKTYAPFGSNVEENFKLIPYGIINLAYGSPASTV